MKKLFLLFLALAMAGCSYSTPQKTSQNSKTNENQKAQIEAPAIKKVNYQDIPAKAAKELINTEKTLVIIDVSPNYAKGHLPGSINFYVGDGSLDRAIPTLDKSLPYLVYCHNNSASIAGATKLIEAGFGIVYRLEGNYAAWVEAGYSIEK